MDWGTKGDRLDGKEDSVDIGEGVEPSRFCRQLKGRGQADNAERVEPSEWL